MEINDYEIAEKILKNKDKAAHQLWRPIINP